MRAGDDLAASAGSAAVPRTFQSPTAVSATSERTASRKRRGHVRGSPGPRRPSSARWGVMTPSCTASCAGATFHCRRRARSAARGRCRGPGASRDVAGVLRLPAVMPSSGTRSVSAMMRRIRSIGTRSSSAAAWVSSARAPWPPSTLPVSAVMVPSALEVQRAPSAHRRSRGEAPRRRGHADEQARAEDLQERPPAAARPGASSTAGLASSRRRRGATALTILSTRCSGRGCRSGPRRSVRPSVRVSLRAGRRWPGSCPRAVAALEGAFVEERLLHRVQRIAWREALDGE